MTCTFDTSAFGKRSDNGHVLSVENNKGVDVIFAGTLCTNGKNSCDYVTLQTMKNSHSICIS